MVEGNFIDLTKKKIGWGTVAFAGAIGLVNLGIDDAVIKATASLVMGGGIGTLRYLSSPPVKSETIMYGALACQLVATKYELYQGIQQLYQTISNHL